MEACQLSSPSFHCQDFWFVVVNSFKDVLDT